MKLECTVEEFLKILKKTSNAKANDTLSNQTKSNNHGISNITGKIPPHTMGL